MNELCSRRFTQVPLRPTRCCYCGSSQWRSARALVVGTPVKLLRNRIAEGSLFGPVAISIPYLHMGDVACDDHFVDQVGRQPQSFRDRNSPGFVDRDLDGRRSERQHRVHVGLVGVHLAEQSVGDLLEGFHGVHAQGTALRGEVHPFAELLAKARGQDEAMLRVERVLEVVDEQQRSLLLLVANVWGTPWCATL